MTTMKDVAKLAGVSTSTVSHVINKTHFVSEPVRERVQSAIDELKYTPSALARGLKINKTKTLGMLITTSTNPFYAEVIKGVERRCYEKNYNLILCHTEGSLERMQNNVEMLMQKRVDGLLLMCTEVDGRHIDLLGQHKPVPSIVMDWGPADPLLDQIQDHSLLGGQMATQYLIDCGHKKIGCLTGPLEKKTAHLRFQGFKQAMQKAQLPIKKEWIIEDDFEAEGGFQAFNKLIEKSELPSALFVGNDMMAMGVINAAHKHGLHIPEDLSIIGYDGINIAKFFTPSLTTIHQPKFRLGAKAVDTLLEKINHERTESKIIKLEPNLIIRDSVKNLNI
jgi:LacI family transcriptional regulator